MKSTLIFVAFVALCISSISAYRTECTRYGGCSRTDSNGNGIQCSYGSCGPVRNQQNRYARGNDYAISGTSKCGLYGCVTNEDPNVSHTAYGSSSGDSKCGPNGCVTDARKECGWYNPFC